MLRKLSHRFTYLGTLTLRWCSQIPADVAARLSIMVRAARLNARSPNVRQVLQHLDRMGVADQLSPAPPVIPMVPMEAVVASMGTAARRLISESSDLPFMSSSQRILFQMERRLTGETRLRYRMMASDTGCLLMRHL